MDETVIQHYCAVHRVRPPLARGRCSTAAAAQHAAAGRRAAAQPGLLAAGGQLSAVERGATDPARAEQIKRYEETAKPSRPNSTALVAQSRRQGCEGLGFFSLFSGQSAQCGPLTNQIQQMRAQYRPHAGRPAARCRAPAPSAKDSAGRSWSRSRRTIAASNTADRRPGGAAAASSRTCSRRHHSRRPPTADSRAANLSHIVRAHLRRLLFPDLVFNDAGRFRDDEQTCQRRCPGTEVALYSHRNPGEDISHATSLGGRPYSELPNAFKYPQAFDADLQLPARRAKAGPMRSSTSTTVPSSAAISS